MPALLFALLCLIWSTTWAAIRVCEQGFSPLWGAALRFLLASAILAGLGVARGARSPRPRGARWGLPLAGLVNAVSYGLIYLAERRIPGGTAAVLGATNPFFVLAASAALGYERATLHKVAGLAVSFFGVVFLFHDGLSISEARALAMAEVLCAAAFLWPTYTFLLRRAGDAGVTPEAATRGFLGWTALFLTFGALVFEGRPTFSPAPAPVVGLLYLAVIGSALAWSLFNHLLRVLPLSVLSTMLFIEPALALGVDWLLGEQAPRPAAFAGAMFVLGGVALVALGQARAPLAATPVEA